MTWEIIVIEVVVVKEERKARLTDYICMDVVRVDKSTCVWDEKHRFSPLSLTLPPLFMFFFESNNAVRFNDS